jgi:hypothetical protein
MKRLTSSAFKKLVGRYFGGLIKWFKNLVSNGNFISTTGWSYSSGSLSAANNTLSATADGTAATQNVQQVLTFTAGKIYYIKAKVRVTNANCTNITLKTSAGSVNASVNNPQQNTWYTLSNVGTGAGDTSIRLQSTYPDAATASGKVFEAQEVAAYDITDFPEQTKAWCDANIAPYIIY